MSDNIVINNMQSDSAEVLAICVAIFDTIKINILVINPFVDYCVLEMPYCFSEEEISNKYEHYDT
jgi:hypothetical protein